MRPIGFFMRIFFLVCFLSSSALYAKPTGVKRSEEMEFDARAVQGQRAEGAVYLFQRKTRALPPLLKFERDYLGAIVHPHFGKKTLLDEPDWIDCPPYDPGSKLPSMRSGN